MLDFIKHIFSKKVNVSSELEEHVEEIFVEVDGQTMVRTALSLTPEKAENALAIQKEMYEEELRNFPHIKNGEVVFNVMYIYKEEGSLELSFFIRNGLSLPINFEQLPLRLVKDGIVVAEQVFEKLDIGSIPSYTARPYKVNFNYENVKVDQIVNQDKSVVLEYDFNYQLPVKVEFENLPGEITDDQRRDLDKYVTLLKPLKQGEVNISPLKAYKDQDGNLYAVVIIRNGSDKGLKIDKLPLIFFDGDKKQVAAAAFEFNNLNVSSHKAVLWCFKFPNNYIIEGEFDLTSWSIALAHI